MCGPAPRLLINDLSGQPSPLLVVLGPTGSGKSSLAVALARRFGGEVVNFDSVQLYRDLSIGAAKTPESERRGVPHHLLDTLAPSEDLSAGAYARLARSLLADVAGRGRLPILAGGTGFYLRAVLDGLSPAPPRDPALRQRLSQAEQRRPGLLHRLLSRCDPPAARRIHPNDHQKLIRAIELASTRRAPREPLTGFRTGKLGLDPDRQALYTRLNERSARMFSEGLIAETAALLAAGLPPHAKPLQALGYKQALQHLTADLPLAEAIAECQTRTRQYAKRQLTWFRAEHHVMWLPGFGNDPAIQQQAFTLVKRWLH